MRDMGSIDMRTRQETETRTRKIYGTWLQYASTGENEKGRLLQFPL